MNTKILWCIARHEMRSHRRLIRTHVFIWVALVISAFFYLVVTFIHMLDAVHIAMLGVISPRYIISQLGGNFIALFCTGVLLLTFDQVKRDEIIRIHEVICAKPISNFELFLGRLIGVIVSLAIPVLFCLVAVVTYGIVAETFSFQVGEPVEVWSVVSFAFFDIVPNFLFFGSLLILLNSAFKSRLLALILALFCLIGIFWLNSRMSLNISKPLQTISGSVLFPSELVPTLFTPEIVFNRLALILAAIGFLYWASNLDTRKSNSPSRDLILGITSSCCGVLVIVSLFIVQILEHNRINEWVKVHDEHFNPTAFPDVQAIHGTVDIKPGQTLELDLTIDVNINAMHEADFVLFSLNPSYKISHLSVAGAEVSDQKFKHGLLKIPRYHFTTGKNELKIAVKGRPDKRFAYLDSRATLSQIVGPDVRQLRQLGTENFIFRSKFVALLPGIKWYPTSGTATNEQNWEHREKDFFTLDIMVSVPQDWIVAGPAKRELLANDKGTTYQFRQTNPLPEFALVGSKFESAAIEVEGILFEVLYSRVHRHTFESLAPIKSKIHERLQAIVQNVRSQRLQYPYETFALVEVPSTLRVFGGGYDLDSVMCPPGLVMVRESTLPTISVNSLIDSQRKKNFAQYNMAEEVWIDWQFQAISQYLQHPMFESNVNIGFFRSLFLNQTSATQEGAHALTAILEHLVRVLFPYAEADFDFQLALDRRILNVATVEPFQFIKFHRREGFHSVFNEMRRNKQLILDSSATWDYVQTVSLVDPVHGEDSARRLRAVRLRVSRIVQLLRDTIGRETLAKISVDLMNRYRGKNFELEEFVALLADRNVNLRDLAGDLMSAKELPGYIGSSQKTQRQESGEGSKFETSFILENGEPVSGPVKLTLTIPMEFGARWHVDMPPLLIEAKQSLKITLESANPVQYIEVEPYLSLNRTKLRFDLPTSNESQGHELDYDDIPFIKSSEIVDQTNPLVSSITIDDLDAGFSVIERRSTSALVSNVSLFVRKLFGESEIPHDKGLPKYLISYRPKTKIWSRWTDPTAFGIYRHTFAICEAGNGNTLAKFSATLPKIGEWKLDYFLPEGHFFEEIEHGRDRSPTGGVGSTRITAPHPVGTFHLEIRIGKTSLAKTLDSSNLSPGWQTVGSFDITENVVDVLVTNKTDKSSMYVHADAIRWTPIEVENRN